MTDKNEKISLKRRQVCTGGLGLAALGPLALAGCGGDAAPAASPSGANAASANFAPASGSMVGGGADRVFAHPRLLHTEADFARMRAKLATGEQPWLSGWNALIANGRAQPDTAPRPLETVIRGGADTNSDQMYIDIARTYQLALRWKVSGNTVYADQAVLFLNAWSSTMKYLTGNADRFLAAGIYGYEFANAAEIMRSYPGWAAADLARFQALMLNVFYPLNHQFLTRHNDADITNYWANWDQCSMASVLAIGVLCDRPDLYDEAIAYFKNGAGNGASSQAVYYVHPGYLGQWQESGRDQGHCTLGIGLAAAFCEMAWNQGDDMYGYDNNRFLAGAEYVAKSNLQDASGAYYSMPFARYTNVLTSQPGLSPAGQGSMRPVWEMVQHHYMNRKGLATPYTALQATRMRPEGDGGNGDQLGFGTLTFSRDPIPAGGAPSGLSAMWSGGAMVLSWWGATQALSYIVKRADSAGGPYTTIASGITDLLTYTDSGMGSGTYYYVITALSAAGESVPSNEVVAYAGTRLHTWLRFDETSGATASDASGNGHTGTLLNGAGFIAGRSGNALRLDGVDDYLSLPQGVVTDLADFTVATWVNWNGSRNWERVFDFGAGTRHYMMLTTRNGTGVPRFAITTNYGVGEMGVNASAPLATGQWAHLAVTLSGSTARLYVNGAEVGSNTWTRHCPLRLGATTQNWIGRSQYPDPYFNGKLDDFRIYQGALTPAELAAVIQG